MQASLSLKADCTLLRSTALLLLGVWTVTSNYWAKHKYIRILVTPIVVQASRYA